MIMIMDSSLHRESSAAPGSGWAALQTKADQGDADAQFSLGLHFSSAGGDAPDFAQAAQWYRKAADQDHTLAQYNLGVMFARGQGMPQNDAVSADWMRKAAEGGDAGGQYHLGVRHHRASVNTLRSDAKESRIEAYKWLHLAATQGYGDSLIARQRVTITMTRAEVDEGNRRAAGFIVRKPVTSQTK
jgi:TPR repeat protein